VPVADFTLAGDATPLAWIERRGLLEFSDVAQVPRSSTANSEAPLLVLSRAEFDDALRRALRAFARPDVLAANPLLRSLLAVEYAAGVPNAATLQAVLRERAAELRGDPRGEKLYRALASA